MTGTSADLTSPPSPSESGFAPQAIACPACGVPTRYALDNPWRPFCSPRCKGADFGAGARENFRVPAAENSLNDDTLPLP